MPQLIKEEKGVVSIVMAIIIPVIVFGVLYVYAMLDRPQQENTAHKIVYASSEAYLSRYNAYMFEQMGLLTNLDTDGLQPIIVHYLVRNKLVADRDAVKLSISYEQLSNPDVFNEAVNEAATVLVGNAFVAYGVNLLDQFAFAEKIKSLNQSIQNKEKKLSEQFDKIGASHLLNTIKMCRDVQAGRRELEALKDHLFAQKEIFFKTLDDLLAVLSSVKATSEVPQQAMKTFVESKEAHFRELEEAFMKDQRDFLQIGRAHV